MKLNEFMCDWVTLTQWADDGRYLIEIAEELAGCGKREESGVMQYRGWSVDGLFFGSAEQGGRSHNMLRVSGAEAERVLSALGEVPVYVKCTRFDVQVTVPLDDCYSARRLTDWCRDGKWKGRKKKVTLIDGQGMDTVYFGSRKSEVFARLYVKEVGKPVELALRFEVELKGGKADTFFRARGSGVTTYQRVIAWEWGRMPEEARGLAPSMESVIDGGDPLRFKGVRHVREDSATFKWFKRSVIPALRRLLNCHDYGQATRRILESLLSE